jgi:hypothetical protein
MGQWIERLVLRDLFMKDGLVYSVYKNDNALVRVEIARHHLALRALLHQVDG